MFFTNLKPILLASFAFGAAVISQTVSAQTKFMTVGSGGITGVYYAAGGAICRLVNRGRASNGIRCSVEATPGSLVNLDSLKRNTVNFAIVQGDLHFQAVKGDGAFSKNGPQEELRSVFSLHAETVVVLARKEGAVPALDDLKGRRFSLGMLGSGSRSTIENLLQDANWKPTDFAPVVERTADEQGYALCEGKVDAFAYFVGHPAPNVMRTVKECGAKLVAVDGPGVDMFLKTAPSFVKTAIPGGTYPGQSAAVPTVGQIAALLTSASVPDTMVYDTVKAVFENFEEFKTLHPALANLDPKKMVSEGLSAPVHPGALRYYKEKGWR